MEVLTIYQTHVMSIVNVDFSVSRSSGAVCKGDKSKKFGINQQITFLRYTLHFEFYDEKGTS